MVCLQRWFTELCKLNSELYLVGGPIRDALLHRPCHDWDFVCRHARTIAKSLSRKLRATFVALDEQNRIYTVLYCRTKSPWTSPNLQGKSIEERSVTP